MKRALAAALCLLAPTAWGQVNLDYHFTYEGSYTPAGLTTPVDVYTLTESTDVDVLGAIVLDIGADYLGYGGNPFQVGIQYEECIPTPTQADADHWLATETFARQSDSHFLIPDTPIIVYPPQEKNDGSLGTYPDPCGRMEVRGLGGLRVAVAILVPDRLPVMDVIRVGIPRYSAVYFSGQIPNGMGSNRYVEAVQFPMLYENAWQGSGTGGQTSTDPNDPTVQWNQLANWSRAVLPGAADDVRIELTNPGQAVASSGTVGSLWVNGVRTGGTFSIPGAADMGITGSLIVGTGGTGAATQSGQARCTIFTLGEESGSYGAYQLNDGCLTVDVRAYVGKEGKGILTQTGGTLQGPRRLDLGHFDAGEGTCRLQGGYMTAGTVDVGYGSSLFHQTGGSLSTDKLYVWRTSTYALEGGETRARLEVLRGTFVQTGGTNIVTELLRVGEYSDPGRYELRGGELRAAEIVGKVSLFGGAFSVQTMDGVLVNDGGVISPGMSIGTMSLGGLVQKSGVLEIELASLLDFDKVLITDSAQLGGELKIDLLGGYLPDLGSEYPILTTGLGIMGAFAMVTEGYEARIDGGTTLMLVVIPEPAAACLLALGGIAILRRCPETARRRGGI